ncbi:SCP1-like small phosphatase 4b [Zea mays]|nr:SCP1-like small phosphatase 4b [Zea mays]
MNKMLSNDCLGTQEPHTFCKTTETLEHSHLQEITLDKTAAGSTLISHQNAASALDSQAVNALLRNNSVSVEVPIQVPPSSDFESILSPEPIYSDLQLKEMNYNAAAMDESTEFLHLILSGNDEGYNSTTELQVWDVVDFYVSENFSALQFDSLMGFTNEVSTSYNDCMNLVDMVERPVARLSLDDTPKPSNSDDAVPADNVTMDPDETSLYLQTKPTDSETESSSAAGDVETEYLDLKLLSRCMPDLMDVDSPNCLSKTPVKKKHVTLVLDLDETLVHSTLDHCDNADFTLEVFFNMKNHTVYVRKRPYLKMFLEKVAQMFEVVIFTASQRVYAEQLIDKLDPDGKYISRRIYRESCVFSDGCYTKDLTILGIDLAKVAIVDNTPQVFQLQVDNGIPIKSWFDDPSDQELIELLPFLESLVDSEDVRPIISKTFHDKLEQN